MQQEEDGFEKRHYDGQRATERPELNYLSPSAQLFPISSFPKDLHPEIIEWIAAMQEYASTWYFPGPSICYSPRRGEARGEQRQWQ
jgi:hypothetical protein